ncbi:DNA-binding transcriptional regulator, AcrR family [Nocardioides scoriae]|uniref:DNA-binding transcriptional regulator, AcrR family n=1 Tax=Nocardioides scoriae TaxID=642780 RepID=A0A1H1NL42_9ACTN|nr:TetR/AcrR family transcriptional regulator [Nocardioides scoriae]SDR99425.1 DNA-binding transcriptional regulator, AcrR family [Nocardioides scoriae]
MTDQSTAADTRSRIVQAAARLLGELGHDGVTTRRVAEQAGVQPPAIYRLFGDKDGLLDAVAEHVLATYVAAKAAVVASAAADGTDPLEDLRTGWQAQIDFGLANPAVFRLLSDPDRGPASPAGAAGRRVLAARVHRVAQAGRLRVGEQRAVDLVHAAGTGAVLTLLASPPEARDLGVADAMLEAVLGHVLTDAPAPGDGGPAATAVAFRALVPRLDVLSGPERALLLDWLDRVVDAATGGGRR